VSSPITATGTGGLTKNGAGNLILSGANAESGTVTINEGKLTLARIDESYARIVKFKERLGKFQEGRMAARASGRNRPYARSTRR